MIFSYLSDAAPDVNAVRLLISDLGATPTFSNADLQQLLDIEGGNVKLAAALGLDTLASNEALVSKRIRTLDLQTDGPAVAAALHAQAESLREQANEAGVFDVTAASPRVPELTAYPVVW